VIVLVWHENPRRYGLALGDWRLGLPVAIAGIAIMAVAIAILGQLPDFRIYYTVLAAQRPAWRLILDAGVDMFAWEFFFRGWLLGAFRPRYGTDAIWLQMIPFALMHVWKPELEVLSTIVGGLAHPIVPLGLAAPLVHGRGDHPGRGRLHLSGVAIGVAWRGRYLRLHDYSPDRILMRP